MVFIDFNDYFPSLPTGHSYLMCDVSFQKYLDSVIQGCCNFDNQGVCLSKDKH